MPEQDINPVPITEPGRRSRYPFATAALILTATAAIGSGCLIANRLSFLQRQYLPFYIRATGHFTKTGSYRFIEVLDHGVPTLGLADDVVERKGAPTLSSSAAGRGLGPMRIAVRTMSTETAYVLMKKYIYDGADLVDFLKVPKFLLLYVLPSGFFFGYLVDQRNNRKRSIGIVRRGPRLLNRFQFNRVLKCNGIGFEVTDRKSLGEFVLAPRWLRGVIRIPYAAEPSHTLVMGDTGTGKSILLRQLLRQIRDRREVAVVYDPDGTFLSEFYDESRGDVILNPLDRRCPFWQPSHELGSNAEALTLAQSLFPDTHAENQFFVKAPRMILAHLLQYDPTPQELVAWLASQDEIDDRIRGTEMEAMLSKAAGAQRGGVLASLGIALNAFRLLPAREECRREWTAQEWGANRKGWIFLTSTKTTHQAQLPLISMWLDTIILRVMTLPKSGTAPVPVWLIIDELASLQKLPQLQTALTEARKYQLKVVLGLQGKSQLEERYGTFAARTLLSQPKTKIFFRTNEPEAAKWVSEALGDQEIARERETASQSSGLHNRRSKSYTVEVKTERAVTAAQIQGVPDRTGFIKHENFITQFRLGIVPPIPHAMPLDLRDTTGFAALTVPVPYSAVETPAPQQQEQTRDSRDLGTSNTAETIDPHEDPSSPVAGAGLPAERRSILAPSATAELATRSNLPGGDAGQQPAVGAAETAPQLQPTTDSNAEEPDDLPRF